MVKKKRKRELEAPGKVSQFILHGEEVPQSKIARFEERMQRSGKINEEDTLSDVATPASLACLTPKPTTLNIAGPASHPTSVDPQSSDELWSPMPTRRGNKTGFVTSSTRVIQSVQPNPVIQTFLSQTPTSSHPSSSTESLLLVANIPSLYNSNLFGPLGVPVRPLAFLYYFFCDLELV